MSQEDQLSHVDASGKPKMVDVAAKKSTHRVAIASATVKFSPGVLERVLSGNLKKGAVLDTARIAGIQGAKRTSDLIPMCHPLRLTDVSVDFTPMDKNRMYVEAQVVAVDRTGVEMEALTAATVAALTIYDMVKAVDRGMVITDVVLRKKVGGKTGVWERPPDA